MKIWIILFVFFDMRDQKKGESHALHHYNTNSYSPLRTTGSSWLEHVTLKTLTCPSSQPVARRSLPCQSQPNTGPGCLQRCTSSSPRCCVIRHVPSAPPEASLRASAWHQATQYTVTPVPWPKSRCVTRARVLSTNSTPSRAVAAASIERGAGAHDTLYTMDSRPGVLDLRTSSPLEHDQNLMVPSNEPVARTSLSSGRKAHVNTVSVWPWITAECDYIFTGS